ncbi:MoeZ/MoeB domain-containing protein [Pavlovales sp. CCMP2436]|nr:MoeZ/MoeB domain-containing protein [Pavlovales sp. CCMP2436]|mmetsp:Transcript_49399/g.113155  ORF Transcript_49399/g.113155 Transcript_49399/m.113155 type:complete len:224 (+) Transcript_49399:378-1049(+)
MNYSKVGYRDLYPKCPPAGAVANCASAGVLGVLPAVVGSLQATEALKLILQLGRTLDGSLLLYSALDMSFVELPIGKRDLPTGEGLWKLGAREAAEAAEGGDGCAMGGSLEPIKTRRLPAPEAAVRMAAGWRPFVLDVRAERESLISSLPGTHLRRAHDALFRPGLLLPSEGDVLVYCRSGARSLLAIAELARAGLVSAERLVNLDGGVNAWAELVDPTMLQY